MDYPKKGGLFLTNVRIFGIMYISMGVDNMENIKEFFDIIFEMCIAIFIIIFGYAIWDNFDLNNYKTAILNDNTKNIEILNENNTLYVHNISKNNNETKLMIKVDKNVLINTEEFILEINNETYNLKELDCGSDEKYNYYDLYNIDFNSYETKNYNYNIIKSDKDLIEYEFINV